MTDTRFIPQNATEHQHQLGVVYSYELDSITSLLHRLKAALHSQVDQQANGKERMGVCYGNLPGDADS
jgi:hypothetical protein